MSRKLYTFPVNGEHVTLTSRQAFDALMEMADDYPNKRELREDTHFHDFVMEVFWQMKAEEDEKAKIAVKMSELMLIDSFIQESGRDMFDFPTFYEWWFDRMSELCKEFDEYLDEPIEE